MRSNYGKIWVMRVLVIKSRLLLSTNYDEVPYKIILKKYTHKYLKSIVEIRTSGFISTNSFQTGLFSMRAHKSHNALIRAAAAKWITPFSGPNCEIIGGLIEAKTSRPVGNGLFINNNDDNGE